MPRMPALGLRAYCRIVIIVVLRIGLDLVRHGGRMVKSPRCQWKVRRFEKAVCYRGRWAIMDLTVASQKPANVRVWNNNDMWG